MNAPEKILSQSAEADRAALAPFPASRKVYVEGSRPDIRVPMREITLTDTPTGFGGEKNAPVLVYDTSGPYTDPAVRIDIRHGLPSVRESSMAKCFANEMVREVAGSALQLMGAYGYSKEYPMERRLRDAWGWGIAGGAIDIQKTNIAGALVGRRFDQRR